MTPVFNRSIEIKQSIELAKEAINSSINSK